MCWVQAPLTPTAPEVQHVTLQAALVPAAADRQTKSVRRWRPISAPVTAPLNPVRAPPRGRQPSRAPVSARQRKPCSGLGYEEMWGAAAADAYAHLMARRDARAQLGGPL